LPTTLTVKDSLDAVVIRQRDRAECLQLIARELEDFLSSSMIEASANQKSLWAIDLISKYYHDTIEDIAICFRRARQGDFGNTFKTRFNLGVFSEWMEKILEDKAAEREKRYNNWKHEQDNRWKTREDYEQSIKEGEKINKEIAEKKVNESEKQKLAAIEYVKIAEQQRKYLLEKIKEEEKLNKNNYESNSLS